MPERESSLRRSFLEAARAILREPETPLDLRKVAERAGKSRTAPYLEFGKESEGGGLAALKMAVATEGFSELTGDLRAAGAGSSEAAAALRQMARSYLAFARREPRLYRLMFGEEIGKLITSPDRVLSGDRTPQQESARLYRARFRLQELVEAVVGQGLREWAVRTTPGTDLERQVMIFWAMLHGTALLMLDGQLDIALGPLTHEEAATLAIEHLLVELDQSIVRSARAMEVAKREKGQAEEKPEARAAEAPEVERSARSWLMSRRADRWESVAKEAPGMRETTPPRSERLAEWRGASLESSRPPLPGALQRAHSVSEALVGARILWVDDHPEWQRAEREMLEALGVEVHMVPTTGSALAALRRESFDLVISDIARGGVADEGLRALPGIRAAAEKTAVIFYVGDLDPARGVPPGAFGITDQVEELLHLVLDVMERERM